MLDLPEVSEAKFTVGHAYDYWHTVLYYGHHYDEEPIDFDEAQAAAIGFASRDQDEFL